MSSYTFKWPYLANKRQQISLRYVDMVLSTQALKNNNILAIKHVQQSKPKKMSILY